MSPLIEFGLSVCCLMVVAYVAHELYDFLPVLLLTDWFFDQDVLQFKPLPSILQFRRRAVFKDSLARATLSPINRMVIWQEITKLHGNLNVVLPKGGHVKDPWFVIGRVVITEKADDASAD